MCALPSTAAPWPRFGSWVTPSSDAATFSAASRLRDTEVRALTTCERRVQWPLRLGALKLVSSSRGSAPLDWLAGLGECQAKRKSSFSRHIGRRSSDQATIGLPIRNAATDSPAPKLRYAATGSSGAAFVAPSANRARPAPEWACSMLHVRGLRGAGGLRQNA
jgi:hypothetical protein